MRFKSIYVQQIPLPKRALPEAFCKLSSYINFMYEKRVNSKDLAQDKLMLEYFEQIINALVYELYLSEDLYDYAIAFADVLQREELPAIDSIRGDKLAALRAVFQRLYAPEHRIRQNLFALDTLPVVRLIEGKA